MSNNYLNWQNCTYEIYVMTGELNDGFLVHPQQLLKYQTMTAIHRGTKLVEWPVLEKASLPSNFDT